MIEVIPTILVQTEEEFREQFRAVEALVSWVQIDIVDGKFAPNVTWGEPDVVAAFETSVRFEVDLMVEDNEAAIKKWLPLAGRVQRIYFHQESARGKEREFIQRIKDVGIEAGLAQNPDTAVEELFPHLEEADAVFFLGVTPGFQGQQLQEHVIEKVAVLHEKFPALPIEVDGGVKAENAGRLAAAGVSRLAVGSFIFKHSGGPAAAIEELKEAVE